LSILYLRFIELFAFFGMVFAARFLGDFSYHTNLMVDLFLGRRRPAVQRRVAVEHAR
jgi:hypothetical protein